MKQGTEKKNDCEHVLLKLLVLLGKVKLNSLLVNLLADN